MVTAAIANGGTLLEPRVVHEVLDADGNVIQAFQPRVRAKVGIDPEHLALVRRGMAMAVLGGTAGNAWIAEMQVAGKTGTAEFGDERLFRGEFPTHGWFLGFAPYEEPQVAVVVFQELGAGYLTAEPGRQDPARLGRDSRVRWRRAGRRWDRWPALSRRNSSEWSVCCRDGTSALARLRPRSAGGGAGADRLRRAPHLQRLVAARRGQRGHQRAGDPAHCRRGRRRCGNDRRRPRELSDARSTGVAPLRGRRAPAVGRPRSRQRAVRLAPRVRPGLHARAGVGGGEAAHHHRDGEVHGRLPRSHAGVAHVPHLPGHCPAPSAARLPGARRRQRRGVPGPLGRDGRLCRGPHSVFPHPRRHGAGACPLGADGRCPGLPARPHQHLPGSRSGRAGRRLQRAAGRDIGGIGRAVRRRADAGIAGRSSTSSAPKRPTLFSASWAKSSASWAPWGSSPSSCC